MQVGDSFREKKKKKKTPLVIRFSLPNAVKLKFLAHHASIFPEWKRAPKVPVVRTTFFQRPSKTRELTGLLRVDEKLELIGLCNQEEKNEARPAGSSCIEMQVFSLLSRSPWAVINRWKKNKEGKKNGILLFPMMIGSWFPMITFWKRKCELGTCREKTDKFLFKRALALLRKCTSKRFEKATLQKIQEIRIWLLHRSFPRHQAARRQLTNRIVLSATDYDPHDITWQWARIFDT